MISLSVLGCQLVARPSTTHHAPTPTALPQVTVLDHHKTAAAELTDPALAAVPSLEVHFDMERSGATVR